jgi:hypothetical protein
MDDQQVFACLKKQKKGVCPADRVLDRVEYLQKGARP